MLLKVAKWSIEVMSTKNPQAKNTEGTNIILSVIPVLALVIMIILAVILRDSIAVLGIIINGFGVFFTFLGFAPGLQKQYNQFFTKLSFKKLSFKQLFVASSFALNVILVGIIIWSSFHVSLSNGKPGRTEQRPLPTTSIGSTATAAALATAQTQLSASATAAALQNIYNQATSGAPTNTDTLNAQGGLNWDTYPPPADSSGSCIFKNEAYYATATPGNSTSCEATLTNFSDLALQAEVTVIHGNGGIIFRSNSQEDSFYAFRITTDGKYLLEKSIPSGDGQDFSTLTSGNSSAIARGTNQSNQLTIITHGSTFYLYVNGHYVDSSIDSSYKSGAVGVFTNSDDANQVEAVFKNIKVWKL